MEGIILKENMKRHRDGLIGIFFLTFLAVLFLTGALTIWQSAARIEEEELLRLGYGDLTAWVSGDETMLAGLSEELSEQGIVSQVSVQPLVFSDYEINGQDSDSEGQLVLYDPQQAAYRFFDAGLSGHEDAPEEIGQGMIYLPASAVSMYGAEIGDEIRFSIARQGGQLTLTVAGFFEDPFMGSSMIGMKSFLVSEATFTEAQAMLENAGIDGLAREGGMIHITAADTSITAGELNQILYENTSLASYADFLYSADTIAGFMMTLQNVFTGFLAAFVLILLAVTFVVVWYSLGSAMERDTRNMGILKTMGMTGRTLRRIWIFQYLIPALAGIVSGIAAAVPVSWQAGRLMVTTTGIWIRPRFPIGLLAAAMAVLLTLMVGFLYYRTGKIGTISPMDAIRNNPHSPVSKTGFRLPVKKEGMELWLALRQLLEGKKRYISVCLTALLLVFFASMAGRLDAWLEPDGQGLMDAFNPADLDLAVQPVNAVEMSEIERLIEQYTEITDQYSLAMPDVAVEGLDYTANVITEPERFHILSGRTIQQENEIVVTEFVAADLEIGVGGTVSVAYQGNAAEFIVVGIYQCANEMGANLGMSREGFGRIGTETENMWCNHYFLQDTTRKAEIITRLEQIYGSGVYIHENSWPGLEGILTAMKVLLTVFYLTAALFALTVTVLTASRLLAVEQKDMGIYRSMGFSGERLRRSFAVRFGVVSLIGAAGGVLFSAAVTDSLVGLVLRSNGISNFHSQPDVATVLFPAAVIAAMFWAFSYLYAGKIKKTELTILASGE